MTSNLPQSVLSAYDLACQFYRSRSPAALQQVGAVGEAALDSLQSAALMPCGTVGAGQSAKNYYVLTINGQRSRPLRQTLFIRDPNIFKSTWSNVTAALNNQTHTLAHPDFDRVFYTCIIALAASYDLFQRSSRKTPGTFFEVAVGSLLEELTGLPRGTQIAIPGSCSKVTTDIHLRGHPGNPSLVIPTKITTRERIVQVYAHQRILDSVFGLGVYKSLLIAVSETQLDEQQATVKEICVPGQVLLFQNHLAQLNGIYYLDPPSAYSAPSFTAQLPVKPLSSLVSTDLPGLMI